MRATEFITELEIPRNQWTMTISNADKEEVGPELINLVKNAYLGTPQGSFIHSVRDVLPSDWDLLDWDDEPGIDAAIFCRWNRPGEPWIGRKIQGIGHDGQKISKDKCIQQIISQLQKPGWWVECSDKMRFILKAKGAPVVSNERMLRRLFQDPDLKMIDDFTYTRHCKNGLLTESVFGDPTIL